MVKLYGFLLKYYIYCTSARSLHHRESTESLIVKLIHYYTILTILLTTKHSQAESESEINVYSSIK